MEQLLFVHHRIKVDIISYLKKFVLNLLRSLSQPTRVLAAIIQSDIYSVSGRNLVKISVEARIDLLAISRMTLVEKLDKHREAPKGEDRVLGVIHDLLEESHEDGSIGEKELIKETLHILCVS